MTVDVKRYPILVVDDEQDNLDAFRFNFRKTFDILTATSGPEALSILADKDVAVVVTDQRMPKMTGVELLREVRAKTPETEYLRRERARVVREAVGKLAPHYAALVWRYLCGERLTAAERHMVDAALGGIWHRHELDDVA